MKICDKRKKQEWPEVSKKPVPGRVYQVRLGKFKGQLHIADENGDLIHLADGECWCKGGGFGADRNFFRDVTDYVCLGTSRLPPLEDDA